jgi:hypothetical protein
MIEKQNLSEQEIQENYQEFINFIGNVLDQSMEEMYSEQPTMYQFKKSRKIY